MRSRRRSAAMVAAGLLGGAALATACGGSPTAFHPTGSLPTVGRAGHVPLSSARGASGIDFQTPLPARALQRAIVIGYEDYARSRWAGRKVSGQIRYFNTAVTGVYFGSGAAVSSCVDAAGWRYLEEVAEGRQAGGAWVVTHVDTYPVTSSQGATCQ